MGLPASVLANEDPFWLEALFLAAEITAERAEKAKAEAEAKSRR